LGYGLLDLIHPVGQFKIFCRTVGHGVGFDIDDRTAVYGLQSLNLQYVSCFLNDAYLKDPRPEPFQGIFLNDIK
jgi:hypothetical protein